MRWLLAAAVAILAGVGTAASVSAADERAGMAGFGPWPPAAAPSSDHPPPASNAAAVELGERLFNSARLSGDGRLRCASCHEPWRGFTDGRARAMGRVEGARNTPSLLDVAWRRTLGWDGTFHRLEDQSLRPLRDATEMAASPSQVAALMRGDPILRAGYEAAFGASPPSSDDTVFGDVGRALAAYERTLASARTRFDDWRDGAAGVALDDAQMRGLRLFVGRAGCAGCHAGPAFSDDRLHRSTFRSLRPDGTPDAGRAGGMAYAFRTPTLRGLGATAPYMHDGHVDLLCDAVRTHALDDAQSGPGAGADSGKGARAFPSASTAEQPLTASQRTDLVAFLHTLDPPQPDGTAAEAPDSAPCRE